MAFAVNFSPLPLRLPEVAASSSNNYPKSLSFTTRKRPMLAFPAASSSSEPAATNTPEIQLEFLGPKPGGDGKYPVDTAAAVSGEKLLRNIMLDNKLELYATYGKAMNCGGGGSCGTCIVEVVDGKELLNERTNTELKYLKNKPESWRLACQTIVGNKENSGKLTTPWRATLESALFINSPATSAGVAFTLSISSLISPNRESSSSS